MSVIPIVNRICVICLKRELLLFSSYRRVYTDIISGNRYFVSSNQKSLTYIKTYIKRRIVNCFAKLQLLLCYKGRFISINRFYINET